jgi:putative tryptophan/tyrosine transport system substrate-binding protein
MKRREFISLLGSAAAGWPLAVRAQQPAVPVIGYLDFASRLSGRLRATLFRQGLADAGYLEGRDVAIEYRWADLQWVKVREMATELARRQVAVIVAPGGVSSALAAKAATSTIPIVIASGVDPVRYGLVASLNRPGGNVTGVTYLGGELAAKRFGLLCEMVPQATTIAYLTGGPGDPRFEETSNVTVAAQALGRQLVILRAVPGDERSIDAAFGDLVRNQAGALMVGNNPIAELYRNKILALAQLHRIPATYASGIHVFAGGLMSYSVARGAYRQLAVQYVAPILRGAKPADLPVQQPTKFELMINLKTAKALGLEVPRTLLAMAEEVIE